MKAVTPNWAKSLEEATKQARRLGLTRVSIIEEEDGKTFKVEADIGPEPPEPLPTQPEDLNQLTESAQAIERRISLAAGPSLRRRRDGLP